MNLASQIINVDPKTSIWWKSLVSRSQTKVFFYLYPSRYGCSPSAHCSGCHMSLKQTTRTLARDYLDYLRVTIVLKLPRPFEGYSKTLLLFKMKFRSFHSMQAKHGDRPLQKRSTFALLLILTFFGSQPCFHFCTKP